jgi:hypothetical protein
MGESVLEIPDAQNDIIFADNPHVTGDPYNLKPLLYKIFLNSCYLI